MFSFYGSKSKIIKKYPAPLFDVIIEPFAGSARYALEYWDKEIVLADVDTKIICVWNYLQHATAKEILQLPNVPNATVLNDIDGYSQLSPSEKWLIGFCCNGGSAQPKNVSGRHNFNGWNKDKIRIARDLYKIKHWEILCCDYREITRDGSATWFIDPPYKKRGKWYKHHDIDYPELADWCKSRNGQKIVCENDGADWLPFEHLTNVAFTHFKTEEDKKKITKEVIWYKIDTGT